MKKLLVLFIPVVFLTSCAVNKPLYSWNKYDISSYNYLKKNDEKSTQELIKNYELIIAKQKSNVLIHLKLIQTYLLIWHF